MTDLIILNGGSSSGKTSIARCLQDLLPRPWLFVSVDDFVDALPPSMQSSDDGIEVGDDGSVAVGDAFLRLEAAWRRGIATMARGGAPVIADDVFLGGPASQQRWRDAVEGLDVLWVGVRCDAAAAAKRERARGDRAVGMAEAQAELVHRGVDYDLEVDSTHLTAAAAAEVIVARIS